MTDTSLVSTYQGSLIQQHNEAAATRFNNEIRRSDGRRGCTTSETLAVTARAHTFTFSSAVPAEPLPVIETASSKVRRRIRHIRERAAASLCETLGRNAKHH